MSPRHTWQGGCHCGAVRFRVETDVTELLDCNCSICAKKGFLYLIVPGEDFTLLQGNAQLTTYTWGTGAAKHLFCAVCGIGAFYRPRSHPEGYSVNARCLDGGVPEGLTVRAFDGQNWEQNIGDIR